MLSMTNNQREIQRKLRVLRQAEAIGSAAKTCRHSRVVRASFYRWRKAYRQSGAARPDFKPRVVGEPFADQRRSAVFGSIRSPRARHPGEWMAKSRPNIWKIKIRPNSLYPEKLFECFELKLTMSIKPMRPCRPKGASSLIAANWMKENSLRPL